MKKLNKILLFVAFFAGLTYQAQAGKTKNDQPKEFETIKKIVFNWKDKKLEISRDKNKAALDACLKHMKYVIPF